MKRFLVGRRWATVAVLLSFWAASVAAASHPVLLRQYRFIPSHSRLVVNGSSVGQFEEVYRVRGTFGLITGYEQGVTCLAIGCPPPPLHLPFAKFTDVVAGLFPVDSPLPYVLDLDQTLNLSGLHGTFRNSAPNQLSFHGMDGDGRPFHLTATLREHLIRLVGQSGPGCCDVNHYLFEALAYRRPFPDLNLDGVVDGGDYVRWRNQMAGGENGLAAASDVEIGPEFYSMWREHYGEVIDMSVFDDAGINASTTPEPATLLMAVLGAAVACLCRRR